MAKRAKTDNAVLYIADMADLLPYDAERNAQSSPLPWGKFRTPAALGNKSGPGPKSRHELYSMRRSAIKTRAEGFAFLGVYDELLIHYGLARRAALRGWLVNHLYRRATPRQIAAVLACGDVRLISRAMRALEAEGLLVRVPMPDLASADRKDTTTYPAGTRPEPPGGNPAAMDGGGEPRSDEADEPDDSGKSRNADDAPDGAEATAEGEAEERAGQAGDAAGDGGARAGPPGLSGCHPDGNRLTSDVRRETGDGETGDSADGNGRREDEKQPAPAAPPPAETETGQTPTGGTGTAEGEREAAGGELADAAQPPPPPAEAEAEAGEPTEADPGGSKDEGTARDGRYRDQVDVLTEEILHTLYPNRQAFVDGGRMKKPPQTPDEFEARERGTLQSAWAGVMLLGLDQVTLVRLAERAGKEADRCRRKPRLKKPPGAAWRRWLNEHMKASCGPRWATATKLGKGASGPP